MRGAKRLRRDDEFAPRQRQRCRSRHPHGGGNAQHAQDGALRSSMSISVELGSGRKSAKIATANTSTTQPIAAQNSGPSLRPRFKGWARISSSSVSSSVAMADPGVEDGVEQIDDEVHDDEARGDQKHHALQDDEVASRNRADQQPPDSR